MDVLLSGPLLARIPFVLVMLGLGWLVSRVPPITLPTFCTTEFGELFKLGGVLRVIVLWPMEV